MKTLELVNVPGILYLISKITPTVSGSQQETDGTKE